MFITTKGAARCSNTPQRPGVHQPRLRRPRKQGSLHSRRLPARRLVPARIGKAGHGRRPRPRPLLDAQGRLHQSPPLRHGGMVKRIFPNPFQLRSGSAGRPRREKTCHRLRNRPSCPIHQARRISQGGPQRRGIRLGLLSLRVKKTTLTNKRAGGFRQIWSPFRGPRPASATLTPARSSPWHGAFFL